MLVLQKVALVGTTCLLSAVAAAQDVSLIQTMANNEVTARKQEARFSYVAEERSVRTGGHLWKEKVVETDDGPLHRLIAVDGRTLTAGEAKVEADRIGALVADPSAFRQTNAAHLDDESHAAQLLQLLPKAFLVTPAGEEHGCTRFAFRPNPAYQPASYEERVVHAMGGTVSLQQPVNRLCHLDAKILEPVAFGYGFLGRIEQGGHFSLERTPVNEKNWKSDRISVHMQGRILLLKSLTRDQDVLRTEIREAPKHLSLEEAARLTQP